MTRTYIYDAEDIVEERISGISSDTIRYHHGVGIDEPLARGLSSWDAALEAGVSQPVGTR